MSRNALPPLAVAWVAPTPDGVGTRHDAVTLRSRTPNTGSAEPALSRRASVIKENYRKLLPAKLDALFAYPKSLQLSAHDPAKMDPPK